MTDIRTLTIARFQRAKILGCILTEATLRRLVIRPSYEAVQTEVSSGPKESNMKKLMFATLAFVILTTLVSLAQYPANQDSTKETAAQEKQEHKSHAKTVTGCLKKGDEPSEFSITGEDGKTWGLRSSNVKLEEHLGHQVTVTGSAHRESKAQEKAEEKKEGQMEKAASKEEYGDLSVTDLKMVSETCSK